MTIAFVKKNNGRVEKFQLSKLSHSLSRALHRKDALNHELAQELVKKTKKYLESKGKEIMEAREIRDAMLHVLREEKLEDIAVSYELASLHSSDRLIVTTVLKRNGRRETFHPVKLFTSIAKSFRDAGVEGGKLSEEITKQVIHKLEATHKEHMVPVEFIRRTTAHELREQGLKRVERSYLLHKYL